MITWQTSFAPDARSASKHMGSGGALYADVLRRVKVRVRVKFRIKVRVRRMGSGGALYADVLRRVKASRKWKWKWKWKCTPTSCGASRRQM